MMFNSKSASFLFAIVGVCIVTTSQKPWEPQPRTEKWWLERHQHFRNISASQAEKIKVVFIGSSSIEYWNQAGRQIWDSKYAPLGSVNFGIGGDRTEHVIWRVQEGELDGLNPKVVVVYIGSNNVPVVPSNNDIVRGVDTVMTKIHEKVPNANLLLIGFFPRGDMRPVNATLTRIRDISFNLDNLVDGDTQRRSHFLDIFSSLAPPTMDRIYEEFYQGDKLHLNTLGYQLWDREMNNTFYSLLN